jgi:hypothetical protein
MDVYEATSGLVEMFGFAVDVFRPEVGRQDGYPRLRRPSVGAVEAPGPHGDTETSCKGARTLPCAPPKRSAKGSGGQYGMGAPSPSGIGL